MSPRRRVVEGGAPDLRFDHAVIAVASLEKTMADYAALGFTVRYGGEHPGRRTHNALITFADGSYLELIAERAGLPPTDDAREAWVRAAVAREDVAFLTFALLTADLKASISACAARGLELRGPSAGRRASPDGRRIAWRAAMPPTGSGLPFLIEDVTPRHWRISDRPADTQHANGARGLLALELRVTDFAHPLKKFARLLGDDPEQDGATARFDLGGMQIALRASQGNDNDVPVTPYALTLSGPARELQRAKSGFPLSLATPAEGS